MSKDTSFGSSSSKRRLSMHMQIYEHCQSSCSFPKPANSLSPVESSEISAHRLATSGEINCFWLMQKLGSFPWRMEMVIPASIQRGQPKREISRTCAMVRSAKKESRKSRRTVENREVFPSVVIAAFGSLRLRLRQRNATHN